MTQTVQNPFRSLSNRIRGIAAALRLVAPAAGNRPAARTDPNDRCADESFYLGWCMHCHW